MAWQVYILLSICYSLVPIVLHSSNAPMGVPKIPQQKPRLYHKIETLLRSAQLEDCFESIQDRLLEKGILPEKLDFYFALLREYIWADEYPKGCPYGYRSENQIYFRP